MAAIKLTVFLVFAVSTCFGQDTCSISGDVRLVNGGNNLEGRVEVCNGVEWGTVCDDAWDIQDANVVCRQLGFAAATSAPMFAQFGPGSGPIVLDNVGCTGSENFLFDCDHNGLNTHNCVHFEDASVVCTNVTISCEDDSLRLEGGSNTFEGRLEICQNNTWGTVCDDGFGTEEARVACGQLGLPTTGASFRCCSEFGSGSGPILLDDVVCDGTEESLIDCVFESDHNCGIFEHVGIVCQTASCTQGDVRLADGPTDQEGRVEVCNAGNWGTVCDDLWDINDANVVCRQLGMDNATAAPSFAFYGQGTGNIVLDNLGCTGNEDSIFDCPHNGIGIENCNHFEDASAVCGNLPVECTVEDIRLVGGATDYQGRVEVCGSNGRWSTVCDDLFGLNDATVACRHLGFPTDVVDFSCCAAYGQGTGDILLDNLACTGDETSLLDCGHNGENIHNCGHSEDVGITCSSSVCTETSIRLVDGGSQSDGRVEVCANGAWGTVCDDGFDTNNALVACRQLGLEAGMVVPQSSVVSGSGAIVLSGLSCTGDEQSLFDCPLVTAIPICTHVQDAGVTCEGEACTQGDIRLVDGANNLQGRVEVCNNNRWGTVCDDFFGTLDAQAACRQLGFSATGATAQGFATYGQGTGDIVLDDLGCAGTEASLFACDHNGVTNHNCNHFEDVGVTCSSATCDQGDVRLVNPGDPSRVREGRVEICSGGAYGTVCDNQWDLPDAVVVCTQLGYGPATSALENAAYGQGTGSIVLGNTACMGTENTLFECPHSTILIQCFHADDASVVCSGTTPVCTQGDIRLVNGSNNQEGRVEVCYNGQWGTVCNNGFSDTDAQVVCRYLGYTVTGALAGNNFGQGTGDIILDNLGCAGTESSLFACPHDGATIHSCTHSQDVGVTCPAGCVEGAIRLVGGVNNMQGRVEVCVSEEWGTVCDDSFGTDDANVACRQLGFSNEGATAQGFATYGQGTGDILLDDLGCAGTEASLFDCPHTTSHNCAHSEDVGVTCQAMVGECFDGEVRLVNGLSEFQGRVEVCNSNAWGTVCDDLWDVNDATVVCRQLGYGVALSAPTQASFGQGTGSIVLDNVECAGGESSIFDCPHNGIGIENCAHSEDAGADCTGPIACENGQIRLVDGSTDYEGRVEVCDNFEWGTVCDDDWDLNDAQVACRQLGFGVATSATSQASFGQGTGSIVLDQLACAGSEASLFDCTHNGLNLHDCSHFEDAGVVCRLCNNGDVRLVGGTSEQEGRVEICDENQWGTVCDDAWGIPDASVVCRQLGFGAASSAPGFSFFGQGTGPILLDNVNCVGTEMALLDCPHNGLSNHNCIHFEDAGAICLVCTNGDVRLVGGSNEREGRVEVCDSNAWGTVCDDAWDINDATVVCNQLEFNGATDAPTQASFGPGTGAIVLDNVGCVGTESSIFDCPHNGIGIENCAHFEDAGAVCGEPRVCTEDDIRFVGGEYNSGRVEVCNGNAWGTVCDDFWDATDAGVACRQLGFPGAERSQCCAAYGQGTGNIVLDNLLCVGSETSLTDCPHNGVNIHNCAHSEDAGLICNHNVRLVDGDSEYNGRVEVYINGAWGTVCDDSWDINDANVVCGQLGYGIATGAPRNARYGQGTGQIVLDDLNCVGNETTLFDCPHNGVNLHNCAHFEDASAECQGVIPCNQGDVRLVGGTTELEGRVEVCYNGEWGTVCDDFWGIDDAHVVCRQLGYPEASSAPCCANFGQGLGDIILDNVLCTGEEEALFDCPNNGFLVHNCAHSEDASVVCRLCANGDVRLVGGVNEFEGRVEFCDNEAWGTVCDDSWDLTDGTVVCTQLGYGPATRAPGLALFGQGTGPIVLDDVACTGLEVRLENCPHSGINIHNCVHFEDAGVTCESRCPQGDVRLVGGTTEFEGRIEICNNNQWGTVCDNGWDNNDAMVVCRQLGYAGGTASLNAGFGSGLDPIWLENVGCVGDEGTLSSCPNVIFGAATCGHTDDAGVVCAGPTTPPPVCSDGEIRLVDGPTERQGRVEVCDSNTWGTVCDDFFGAEEAAVACRQLGLNSEGATAQTFAFYGQGTGPIVLDNIFCTGNESSLFDCTHNGIGSHNCIHFEDVGVTCPLVCADGEIRLVGGTTEREGRVEICNDEEWGTVCDDSWDDTDASVVCFQLGYGREGTAFSFAFFGPGTGPIFYDDLGCNGQENRLIECSHSGVGQHNCVHFEDASVRCTGFCTDGDVRLIGGSSQFEGRVELCSGGSWGTICDDFWGDLDASVVCSQLGFTPVGARGLQRAVFGEGTGDILLDDVMCVGTEARLLDCPALSTHNCLHFEDSSVVCSPDDPPTCSDLTPPLNGFVTYSDGVSPPFSYLSTADYNCDPGYALVDGDNTTTCNASGLWEGNPPTCQSISCGALSMVTDAVIVYSPDTSLPYDYGTIATYTCINSHYIEGDEVRTCGGDDSSVNGTWSGNDPICAAIMCPVLFPPQHGFITYTEEFQPSFGFMEIASYGCNAGFALLGGDIQRTCTGESGSSGNWDGIEPVCQEITCPAVINAISNGQILYTLDNSPPYEYGTVASFICDIGFASLNGDTHSTCGGDDSSITGVWSGTIPTCEPYLCAPLPVPANTMITYVGDTVSPYNFGTLALYSCNVGYNLLGNPGRTCQGMGTNTTGDWDSTPPACVATTCPAIAVPVNAMVEYDSPAPYNFQATATFTCTTGYGLAQGSKVRVCIGGSTGDDSWTGDSPACQAISCPVLDLPVNGGVSYTSMNVLFYGSVATYSCNPGYGINGEATRSCGGDGESTLGEWEGTPPTCEAINCMSLEVPPNGQVTYSGPAPYGFGTVATYTCDSGVTAVRTCVGDTSSVVGQWNGTAPSCAALSCPALPAITNGVISYSPNTVAPYNFGTTATFTCNPGSFLGGASTRTCGVDGSWSGSSPVCSAVSCPALFDPANGMITFSGDSSSLVATYSCNEGFAVGTPGATRTCTAGVWSSTIPSCQAISCPVLTNPSNGLVNVASRAFGSVATYTCNNGFGLSGGDTSLTCGGDGSSTTGTWTGTVPTCGAVTCSGLVIANGVVTYNQATTAPFNFATAATFTCNDGFFLVGDRSRSCGGDGSSVNGVWSGTEASCQLITCGSLPVPDNGVISYSLDTTPPFNYLTTATYTCNPGYTSSNPLGNMRTCVASNNGGGMWNGVDTSCVAITCPSIPLINNGVISYSGGLSGTTYPYATIATITCRSGYGLSNGNADLSCGGTGTWGDVPMCLSITCSTLNPILNGQIQYFPSLANPVPLGTRAQYTCNDGYFIEGNSDRSCDGDTSSSEGLWDGVAPICSEILCITLLPPANGRISYSIDMSTPFDYQTMATYTCDNGFQLTGGDQVRTCVGSSEGAGQWSGTGPTCEMLSCPSLPVLTNGVTVYSSDEPFGPGATARYSCNTGYGISGGDSMLTCGGDGTWIGTQSTCQLITCPGLAVSNGQISYSSGPPYNFGTTATYSCDTGFTLQGTAIRTCTSVDSSAIGEFSGLPPTCVSRICNALPDITNGVITYSAPFPYIAGTTATYTCSPGYQISGSSIRTCVGTPWDGLAPICIGPGFPANIDFTQDPNNCDSVTISWLPPLQGQGSITRYLVTVSKNPSGESQTVTASGLSWTFSLDCCQQYDFSVAAGNEFTFGEPLTDLNGFRTLPDLSVMASVRVSVASQTSLSVSWTEATGAQHLSDDMFTVSTAPSCSNGQTGIASPPTQTVPFTASPVVVSGLDPQVRYSVRVDGEYCDSVTTIYEGFSTTSTDTGSGLVAPVVTSANRVTSNPTSATVTWSQSGDNIADISISVGDTFDTSVLVSTFPVADSSATSMTLTGLDVCVPYWVTVRAAICSQEAPSLPFKLDIEDIDSFELSFSVPDGGSCGAFVLDDPNGKITFVEASMNTALLGSDCRFPSDTCFAMSSLTCSRTDQSNVYFGTTLVGAGTNRGSAVQKACLNRWIAAFPSISLGSSSAVSAQAVAPSGGDGIPSWGAAIIVLIILGVIIIVGVLAAFFYWRYSRGGKFNIGPTPHPRSINNADDDTASHLGIVSNPMFSETDLDGVSLSSGARDKAAEAEEEKIDLGASLDSPPDGDNLV